MVNDSQRLVPAQYSAGRGDQRLDFVTWSRFLADKNVRSLLDAQTDREVEIDLGGFKYVNVEGVTCLLALAQHLGLSRRHVVYLRVPATDDIADQLDTLGFYETEPTGLRVLSPAQHRPRWRAKSPAIRSSIRELTPTTIYNVQAEVDKRFMSSAFLEAIDLSALSESAEFARDLADAVQEMLRNVLQHSEVRRGFIGFQKIGDFKLQFVIADWGQGIHRSFATGSPGPEGARVVEAVLHRFAFPDRPGLFTVARAVAQWGGSLALRTGGTLLQYRSDRREIVDDAVAAEIKQLRPERVSQFPGVQCSVSFDVPRG